MAIDTPHFSFPFQLRSNGAALEVVEQDSFEEVEDCVAVLLQTERGERIDLPDYGVTDLPFVEGGTDLARLAEDIAEWEDRADFALEQTEFANFIERIRVALRESNA